MNLLNGGLAFFSRYTLATLTGVAILGAGGVSLVQRTSASEPPTATAESTSDPPAWMDDTAGFMVGQSCSSSSDCKSGHCVDGVCCASACADRCMACNVAGMEGTCSPLAEFDADPLATPACVSPNAWCNGAGACVKAPGQACSKAVGCASGYCVDGVCCNSSCTGTCMSCAVAGHLGTCSAVPANQGDPSASSPCNAPTSLCNGAGVCMGSVGATCTSNADCYSDNCDNGFCGYALPQSVWSQDTAACSADYFFSKYMRIGFTDIVATADGRVFGVGKYEHSVMGLDSLEDLSFSDHTLHQSGPHDFKAEIDSLGQAALLSSVGTYYLLNYSLPCTTGICQESTSGVGPFITSAGGDVVYYYRRHFFSKSAGWQAPIYTCDYGIVSKLAVPQWSLGTSAVCGGYSNLLAGDDAGNVLAMLPPYLQKFDPSGAVVLNVANPFMGPISTIALTPSGSMYSAGYTSTGFQLTYANGSGIRLWVKLLPDPLAPVEGSPVYLAVDANGNAIAMFYAYGSINLGNGSNTPIGSKDLVLAKFNPQGNVLWAKRMGGPGFSPIYRAMKTTGANEIALALSFYGSINLGDGQINSRTVVVKYDANGNLVWRKDLEPVLPSPTSEVISLALSGHPSGAVYVGGSAYGVRGILPESDCPDGYVNAKPLRLFVAKYAP